MRPDSRRRAAPLLTCTAALAALSGAFASSANAVTVARARVVVDATASPRPAVTTELTLSETSSQPQTSVAFFLVREVAVESAQLEGQQVAVASADQANTSLRKWTLTLPQPVTSAKTRVVSLRLGIAAGNPALRTDADGGLLLPGAGWFPMLEPYADLVIPHSTSFTLPAGVLGIACGNAPSGNAPWTSTAPGRPFAAWGRYTVSKETRGTNEIEVWRRTAGSAESRAVDLAVSSWNALDTGLGAGCGSGALRLVDAGSGILAGGQRALFWDEARFAREMKGSAALDAGRELTAALATAFWSDCLTFTGEDAGWLSRAIPEYLGDVAYVASLRSETQEALEAELLGARRDLFLRTRAKDRPLKGLVPLSPGANDVLRGRGALAIHAMSEASSSRSHWISFLEDVRLSARSGVVTRRDFFENLQRRAPNQHAFITPFLDGTDLPDFRIVSSKPAQGPQKDRLRVEVENAGKVEAPVEILLETPKGEKIRETRISIPPREKRVVMMKDDGRAGTIRLDPRRTTLQSDVSTGETVTIEASVQASAALVPSYEVEGAYRDARHVTGLKIELSGLSITGFEGIVVPYRTFHGPSGAVLLGTGRVRIAPGPPNTAGWTKAMGREALSFQASEMWLRFPPEAWAPIEAQLGGRIAEAERDGVAVRARPIVEHSFPTGFTEEMRFRIPPPGSSLITFTGAGDELRGFSRHPLPDGRVEVRFWDQLSGADLWEETR